MYHNRFLKAFTVLLILAAQVVVRAEDTAIIVGIGDYKPGIRDLPGIDVDLENMKKVATSAGFTRQIVLWNSTATCEGLRRAFNTAAQTVNRGERFLFFQSSHGTQLSVGSALIMSDTTQSGTNYIAGTELRRLIRSVSGANATVIIDACFSGGLTKLTTPGALVKYHQLDNSVPAFLQVPNKDSGDGTFLPPNVGFFSSTESQTSLVVNAGGRQQSAFTYSFSKQYVAQSNSTWSDVSQAVKREVSSLTQDSQHPVITRGALGLRIFSSSLAASSVAVRSVGDLYRSSASSSDVFDLKIDPDRAVLTDGSAFGLTLKSKVQGWAFIINRDQENRVQFLRVWGRTPVPDSPDEYLSLCQVAPGDIVVGKGELIFRAKKQVENGQEYVKAILVTDRAVARLLAIAAIRCHRQPGMTVSSLDSITLEGPEKLIIEEEGVSKLYTSELTFGVGINQS